MGRPRKPSHLRLLGGIPKRKVRSDEPKPPVAESVEPPAWLTGDARAKWNDLAPRLIKARILSELDADALGLLCTTLALGDQALRIVEREGVVTRSTKATTMMHPAMRVLLDCEARSLALMREFGMTPRSRSNVAVAETGDWDRL